MRGVRVGQLVLLVTALAVVIMACQTPLPPGFTGPAPVAKDGFQRSQRVSGPVGLGRERTYRVDVEAETGLAPDVVAAEVASILGDSRSWIADGSVGFRQVGSDDADIVIRVARPSTVDRLCRPLRTGGRLSCRSGRYINLNVDRWLGATAFWPTDLATYRSYLVNHEVGHFLGHGHAACPGRGQPAPVMMQQTKGLGDCTANGWPYPE